MQLTKLKCVPCEGGVPPLSAANAKQLHKQVPTWELKPRLIFKRFKFKNFMAAKRFLDKVAKLAEREGHHPDILWEYNKVMLVLYTHAAGGLTQNDFVMAAKIDKISQ